MSQSEKNRPRKKTLLIVLAILGALVVVAGGVGLYFGSKAYKTFEKEEVKLRIPSGASAEQVKATLEEQLGEFGGDVAMFWSMRDGNPAKAAGSYVVKKGDRVWSVVNRIRTGTQTPVKVTFNNVRTMDELAAAVAKNMAFDADGFKKACDAVLSPQGVKAAEYPAYFIPDTYEFYYTETAENVVKKMVDSRKRYWDKHSARLEKMGLTPTEVATIASIVEEETAKADERGKVARLYLNRLGRGMKLQADPTVKFAVGDFAIRRVAGDMLKTDSPYNTYLHEGLPPGPIRIAEKSTLEAVMNAPEHNYIYMCAKEDFSGYHNFTSSYDEHLANARCYQSELNRKNIR